MDLPAATLPAPSMVSPVTPLTTRRVMLPLTLLPSFAVAVMVTLPVLRAVTRPLASTVAILLLLLDHVTSAIASSGSHVAFSCKVLLPLKSTYVVGALTVIFSRPAQCTGGSSHNATGRFSAPPTPAHSACMSHVWW